MRTLEGTATRVRSASKDLNEAKVAKRTGQQVPDRGIERTAEIPPDGRGSLGDAGTPAEPHSAGSTRMGSTRMAAHAGRQQAARATARTAPDAPRRIVASPDEGGVFPYEGCRAARFRRRGRPARLPGTGGRKTRRGRSADPLGFEPDIVTVGLGVSWAAWAHGQRLAEAVRAFPTVWGTSWDGLFWHPHKLMKIRSFAAEVMLTLPEFGSCPSSGSIRALARRSPARESAAMPPDERRRVAHQSVACG